MADTQRIGQQAEQAAADYLRRQGLKLRDRNYRCKGGEIDLILDDHDILVFAEIRFRRRSDFGSPAETVGASKQRRLILAAQHYLQRHHIDRPCRFDVLAITPGDPHNIDWIRDAFRLY